MGLDNFPHEYPCKTQGTAVMETVELNDGSTTERIGCDSTVEAGGCPFRNANPPSGQVTGFLGTYCWYRGKHGNWLINALNSDTTNSNDIDPYVWDVDGDNTFYGTAEAGEYRPPGACRDLADDMESSLDERGGRLAFGENDFTDEVKFAIWYLRWAADECNGMGAWS